MQIKLFSIPQYGDDNSEEELNHFLRAHRIVEINKQFVINHIPLLKKEVETLLAD